MDLYLKAIMVLCTEMVAIGIPVILLYLPLLHGQVAISELRRQTEIVQR